MIKYKIRWRIKISSFINLLSNFLYSFGNTLLGSNIGSIREIKMIFLRNQRLEFNVIDIAIAVKPIIKKIIIQAARLFWYKKLITPIITEYDKKIFQEDSVAVLILF